MSYTNFPRGSEWRKWDLHVHTPASVKNQYKGDWDRFLKELEALPADFAVLGINDYMFLDGYKRLREEKEKNGRLKNIHALFPVVEFRIKKFAGVEFRDTTRINLHVIFDPELDPAIIESQFLNTIHSAYTLAPGCSQPTWQGVVTPQSLAALGAAIKKSVPPERLSDYGSDLEEGFNNLNVDEAALIKSLENNSFLSGRYLIAVGKSEWDKIAWDDTSIAEKKDIINRANIVFTASASVAAFENAQKKLANQGVNSLLLDCSDAHSFAGSTDKDRLGNCFTWVKADPTFKGILQLVNEPRDRSFIGNVPPKLELIARNRTKFISSIQIRKKKDAKITEAWFENINLPINPDLIAIIGNKGKGKSALTDIIGLLGNTKQHAEFTFLSSSNFRQPKDNKAKHFEAQISWANGDTFTKGLDDAIDELLPERVKYIPQNFLEKICTQIGRLEETEFDRELKKVIFSHVGIADRLGKTSLDELLSYRTSEAISKIELLKQELHLLNEAIVASEEKSQPEYREKTQNLLTAKRAELSALEAAKPIEVTKPENDPSKQEGISQISKEIDEAKKRLDELEKEMAVANEGISKQTQLIVIVDKLMDRLANLDRQIQGFFTESKSDFEALGISPKSVLNVESDTKVLSGKRAEILEAKKQLEARLDSAKEDSLTKKKLSIESEITQLQSKLDEPNKKYQLYASALKTWESQKEAIVGTAKDLGTIKFYENQLNELGTIPAVLERLKSSRLGKAKEIHSEIRKLADAFRVLYAAVNRFIEEQPLAKEKLHLNFEVGISDTGFEERFFEIVNRGVAGTFCGIEEGHKRMELILHQFNFNTEVGVESFLAEITKALEFDLRSKEPKVVRVSDQIRKGKDKSSLVLYDYIFSLEFLRPRYALRMGEKELHELSPGERGALLLVFYLLVDKDDVPLLIDQPEENLDNQTVFELLVPCMKAAKQRRQIFIVTHNPNLAVVCDAEQIICADLDKKNNYRSRYVPGAIENPQINKAIVNILEGTMPAFDNRDSKYYE